MDNVAGFPTKNYGQIVRLGAVVYNYLLFRKNNVPYFLCIWLQKKRHSNHNQIQLTGWTEYDIYCENIYSYG